MTHAEISKVASITERFTTAHLAAKKTNKELNALRFELFEGLISPEEKEILKKAEAILEEIIDLTSPNSTRKYIINLINP